MVKASQLGLEKELMLLLQKSGAPFPAPRSGSLQPPKTKVLGDQMASFWLPQAPSLMSTHAHLDTKLKINF